MLFRHQRKLTSLSQCETHNITFSRILTISNHNTNGERHLSTPIREQPSGPAVKYTRDEASDFMPNLQMIPSEHAFPNVTKLLLCYVVIDMVPSNDHVSFCDVFLSPISHFVPYVLLFSGETVFLLLPKIRETFFTLIVSKHDFMSFVNFPL